YLLASVVYPFIICRYATAPTEICTRFPTRRSSDLSCASGGARRMQGSDARDVSTGRHESSRHSMTRRSKGTPRKPGSDSGLDARSEEHTSELQSRENLVCRLLLEIKKKIYLPAFHC